MGFFSNTSPSKETPKISWKLITDEGDLNRIVESSKEKPAIIFKHSTRCSISRMALRNFEHDFDLHDEVTPFFLDLLKYRTISAAIATRFHVVHQSPQLLLIKNGQSVYDASHNQIDAAYLKEKIV